MTDSPWPFIREENREGKGATNIMSNEWNEDAVAYLAQFNGMRFMRHLESNAFHVPWCAIVKRHPEKYAMSMWSPSIHDNIGCSCLTRLLPRDALRNALRNA